MNAIGAPDTPSWAKEWAGRAGAAERAVLRAILRRFASRPFAPERLERGAPAGRPWTGAEIRVALHRLVRDGVLIERRRTRGEPQVQLPAAMMPVWQRLLCPVRLAPLPAEEEASVRPDASPHRLPLSLELLPVWAELERRDGLPLTRRGVPNRAAAARLAAAMRIGAGELEALPFPEGEGPLPPGEEERAPEARLSPAGKPERRPDGWLRDGAVSPWAGVPSPLRLALELGLACGTLKRAGARIAADPAGLAAWVAQSRPEADAGLLSGLMERYASRSPSLHFAAGILCQLPAGRWFRVADAAAAGGDRSALETWISLMVACGWMEGGEAQGERVFRWKAAPPADASARLHVLPDLEVWVPPEAGLRCRYVLERIAERVSADEVFVYRLTREASLRARAAGYTRESVSAFLERESRTALPGPVAGALADWYGPSAPVAPDARPPGAIAPSAGGSPAAPGREDGATRPGDAPHDDAPTGDDRPADAGGMTGSGGAARAAGEPGPDARKERAAAGAADDLRALFPGVDRIPPAWLRTMRRYHPSTARQLVERAMVWRTGLRMSVRGCEMEFVPLALHDAPGRWEARGFIREAGNPTGAGGAGGNGGKGKIGEEADAGGIGGQARVDGEDAGRNDGVREDGGEGGGADPWPCAVRPAVVRADEIEALRIELPAEIRGRIH